MGDALFYLQATGDPKWVACTYSRSIPARSGSWQIGNQWRVCRSGSCCSFAADHSWPNTLTGTLTVAGDPMLLAEHVESGVFASVLAYSAHDRPARLGSAAVAATSTLTWLIGAEGLGCRR
jgi:hypothetical protein